jgi:hypothetical protein
MIPVNATKAYRKRRGSVLLGIRLNLVVNSTTPSLIFPLLYPRYLLGRRLGGFQTRRLIL